MTLTNQNICITGTLKKMTRNKAFDRIRKSGGNPQMKLTKSTTILVITDEALSSPTYKLFKADEWQTPCIDENFFYELLGVK